MKVKSLFAALSLALFMAGADARASFTYSVAPVTTSTNFGAGSNSTSGHMLAVGGQMPTLKNPPFFGPHPVWDIPSVFTVAGAALDPRRQYTIAVNGLLAEGGHNYAPFTHGLDRREVGKQYEMVKSWITAHDEISAPPTNRIMKVSDK